MSITQLSKSKRLARSEKKLKEAERVLKRAERSVALWRRKVADLAFEQKCIVQAPLWSEHAPHPNKNLQGDVPPSGANTS